MKMTLSVLLILLICCSTRLVAQQEPIAFASAGRGFPINSSDPWKVDLNASVLGGYRLGAGVMVIAYFDYNGYSFADYYHDTLSYSASRRTFSVLAGAKVSAIIPQNSTSPYFIGALGVSNTSSSSDSVFRYTGGGHLIVLNVSRGNTVSFLAAVGADIEIYRGITAFAEVRTSGGFKSSIYDILWMYRAGIGISIY